MRDPYTDRGSRGGGILNTRCRVEMQPLEGRLHLAAGPVARMVPDAVELPTVAARAEAPAPAVAASSSITLADRQALLAQFSGELARSLGKTLRHSGPDAFDMSLLRYMERRAGPAFFFNPRRMD